MAVLTEVSARVLPPARRLKWRIGATAWGSGAIARLRRHTRGLTMRDTALVVEGFPRSGNSFFVRYLRTCDPEVRLGHHLHVVGQYARAARWDVPAVLVVRRPLDAVLSLLVADPRMDADLAVEWWRFYHQRMLPYLDRVMVLPFEQFTQDPEGAAHAIEARYGLDLHAEPYDEELQERIRARLLETPGYQRKGMAGLVPVPTEEKKARRRELEDRAVAALAGSGCDELHAQILAPR
ncbi:hypothetical protein [Demequina subtropica]|uniref:hypothetical protein n=1 Tax=Demequina subtropica TaxID=1638989 RepID=UPI00078266F3|nr:hypothetical protein [Demequina subtropica]